MHTPEDHSAKGSKAISFPVVIFRSNDLIATKPPVLHLGAGGPGAAMSLDTKKSVKIILDYHDEISVNQGRDLFIIDPRGVGLSKPLLMCETFVTNQIQRFTKNLSPKNEWEEIHKDYFDCIETFKLQGVKLSTYNSISIADDIEMMRKAAKIEKWVLIGVSYAARYAQIITTKHPHSVESMILDSATFPNIKPHDNYLQKSMATYHALYDYCLNSVDCKKTLPNLKSRIWALHKKLNNSPKPLFVDHPYKDKKIKILLNGERLLNALINATYNTIIFQELPNIIIDLEKEQYESITPYLLDLAAFLLDETFGDISASSHYCYEDKPFTDFNLIKQLSNQLPEGYIRNSALLALDQPDYCNEIQATSINPIVANPTKTDVPALFLHGTLDPITPLSDVEAQKHLFTNSKLISFKLSHDILGSSECAEIAAAKFIADYTTDDLTCEEI